MGVLAVHTVSSVCILLAVITGGVVGDIAAVCASMPIAQKRVIEKTKKSKVVRSMNNASIWLPVLHKGAEIACYGTRATYSYSCP
jgi:hypothetical protein